MFIIGILSMKHISQQDIATALGISKATVSLALRRHPRISEETRSRVEAEAARQGYQRAPMFSALSAYRWSQSREFRGIMAWAAGRSIGGNFVGMRRNASLDWRQTAEFRDYFTGASQRASELGYKLEEIYLDDYKTTPSQVAKVLKNRGIEGILGCPMPMPHARFEFSVDDFASVLIGYSIDSPHLHRVATHHFQNMIDIHREVVARGYQRIGYVISTYNSIRVRGNYRAAYLLRQSEEFPALHIPPLEDPSPEALIAWKKHHRPDAIITSRHHMRIWPDSILKRIPSELGVAIVSVDSNSTALAGIDEGSVQIGRVAAQMLAQLIESRDVGRPLQAQHCLIESIWKDGDSLPSRNA